MEVVLLEEGKKSRRGPARGVSKVEFTATLARRDRIESEVCGARKRGGVKGQECKNDET